MKNTLRILFALLLLTGPILAQERKLNKGSKEYEKLAYIDAIATYKRLANQGYKEATMFKKLANSYYFNGKLAEAAHWYQELFNLTEDVETAVYFRYAQTLKAIQDYEKADTYLLQFHERKKEDTRGLRFIEKPDYLTIIQNLDKIYQLDKVPFNSKFSDFGGQFWQDKIVFSSSRIKPAISQRFSTWTGEPFTKLYYVDFSVTDSTFESGTPQLLGKGIKKKYNEASPSFSKDGKTMYYTVNTAPEKTEDENNLINLKIYRTKWNGKKWIDNYELPFNNDAFNTSHPALSADEKWLYFASDRPESFGDSDIFRVQILDNNNFGEVENLGKNINTEGKETFPYLDQDETLYFASEGHPGLGGLDVYKVALDDQDAYLKNHVKNLGTSINSPFDDFAFYFDAKVNTGFITSNRDGNDNIYFVKKIGEEKPACTQQILTVVEDKNTGKVVVGAVVELYDNDFNKIVTSVTNSNGITVFTKEMVTCGENYHIRVSKNNFNTNEGDVRLPYESGSTQFTIKMDQSTVSVKKGDDLAKVFDLENIIYFDLDKANIRKDAEIELAKVVDVLQQNPTMKIEVRSHTDSRASQAYNNRLSDRRATTTAQWITKHGIEPSRVSGKGFGESQLTNECTDGVSCTEAQHQQNRRSEFIITEL